MEVDYSCYQYNIAVPPFNEKHPINKILIPYWKDFWEKLLDKLKSAERLNENEIHWQNRITYITNKERIVGIHFIANYEKHSFIDSEYVKNYLPKDTGIFIRKLKNERINTLQYLSVDPDYHQRRSGINFASILSDISTLQHNELNAGCTFSVIRKSVGMHNMASKVGFKELCTATKHSVDVSIMYNSTPKRHPKKYITEVSDYLWNNRKIISNEEL